jgi:hypothetical protein
LHSTISGLSGSRPIQPGLGNISVVDCMVLFLIPNSQATRSTTGRREAIVSVLTGRRMNNYASIGWTNGLTGLRWLLSHATVFDCPTAVISCPAEINEMMLRAFDRRILRSLVAVVTLGSVTCGSCLHDFDVLSFTFGGLMSSSTNDCQIYFDDLLSV